MIDLTTEPDIGYGRERSKKARWRGQTTADGKLFVVEMTVSHNKGRKAYSASVTRMLESRDRGYTVSEYQPFRDIAFLPAVPVARHSAKALDAAFDESLSRLLALADTPQIREILVPANGEE